MWLKKIYDRPRRYRSVRWEALARITGFWLLPIWVIAQYKVVSPFSEDKITPECGIMEVVRV